MKTFLSAAFVSCAVLSGAASAAEPGIHFVRGDLNGDGGMDISDAIAVLAHLFLPGSEVQCLDSADIDDNGEIEVTDCISGLQYLFAGGSPPPPPSLCGPDPSPDDLGCARSSCPEVLPTVGLAAACSPDPGELRWAVTNPLPDPLDLGWLIEGTAASGALSVPGGGTEVLATPRAPGTSVLVLSWRGAEVGRLAQGGVVISEIMAWNADSLSDEDGDGSDWIEIHALDGPCPAAVDLAGWYLTDDPALLTKWKFPAVSVQTGGYLVVFASGKDRAEAGAELHTNFRLASEGDHLALVAPDGKTIVDEFLPTYPEQLMDVSYGRTRWTKTLVGAGGPVLYRVPAASDAALGEGWAAPEHAAAGWMAGTTGLGFSAIATQGFEVTVVKSTVDVSHLDVAMDVLGDPAKQSAVTVSSEPLIDFFNSGERGNFAVDAPFPGLGLADVENFVVLVQGTVLVPEAGPWSFGVSSDDGFSLELFGAGGPFTLQYPDPRGPADSIATFDIPKAGPYDLMLVFYERGGGSELELFAARGSHATFRADQFRLVGDKENGGLGLLGFADDIGTDVGAAMRGVNASLWARIDFDVEEAGALGGLWLRMKYEDGFVAYLNGERVAARNAPAAPRWDSAAASDRPWDSVPVTEEINLTNRLGLLVDGRNVLAIHGLNDRAADTEFLIQPELVAAGRDWSVQYMPSPTPGAFNLPGGVNFVRSVEFDVERGFFNEPFSLILYTPTDGATIRYTKDGSTPTAAKGSVYAGPLTIDRTTVLRAAAFKAGFLDSKVRTMTYIFTADVIRQSPAGQVPGAGWPTGSVNGQILDYGMDPDVVNDARWSGEIEAALLSIPTISLVTDLGNLFAPATGIYVNAWNDGRAWERRTSIELLRPDGVEGFGLDAGLRIRGAYSRSGSNPKHSFHVYFRNEYGAGKLEYPLFGGAGVDRFDKFDLKTSQNYSWAYEGSTQNTFIRDVFSRDVQRDMGRPHARSRFYHLYINGQYWGLFEIEERADAPFAASYLGGLEDEYDVIKNDSSGSRALHATDGNMDSYRRLYDAAVAGFSTDAAYDRVRGLLPDGTPDPDGEKLLDVENLMDYMICTYYTGDPDSPVSCWAHFSNNIFAIYRRTQPKGFVWIRHDAEHSLGANGGLNEGRLLTDPVDRTIGQNWNHFNPAWLHLRLTAHPEYLLKFADRVNRFFSNGGLLTAGPNIDRWLARAEEIDLAIIAESARWGDAKTNPPRTKVDWRAQIDGMVSGYFPQRTAIVLGQMRSMGMFPAPAIVSFNRPAGEVAPGSELRLSQEDGTPGTIYYTLDGTDPRLPGGAIAPTAAIFTDESAGATFIARGSTWRYKDDGSDGGTAWREPDLDDSGWREGRAHLGYGDGDEATVVGYGGNASRKFPTTYFRKEFDVPDPSAVTRLTLGLVRDDGAVAYLNGREVVRDNMPGGDIGFQTYAQGAGVPVGGADESAFHSFDVDPALLAAGRNVIAVEIHQSSADSTDISFDLELTGRIAGDSSPPIVIESTVTVKARVQGGGQWGALTEGRFTVGQAGLAINEVMASNGRTLEDPDEPGEFPDWIEIFNGTAGPIALGGMYLTDDLQDLTKWQIAEGTMLASGERLIFYADDDGTQGPAHTNFKLGASGEALALVDIDGTTIIDSIVFDGQREDVSFGRFPDGGDSWGFHRRPTPGGPNEPHAP